MKVLIAAKNTIDNDKRTLAEADILAKTSVKVVIIGLLGTNHELFEQRDGFCIKRIKTSSGLGSAANKLKSIIVYIRLFKAMLAENADYYHAHFPLLLMILTYLVAKINRRRFVADYRDMLILEQNKIKENYYKQEGLWGGDLSEKEKDRIQAIHRLIPGDIKTILDAGCGDGRIINPLAGRYKMVGFDYNITALRHVKTTKFIASIGKIPVRNKTFGLVICSEVIEHLEEPLYSYAIQEITRVSSKYIILAVPNDEQLSIGKSYCPKCKVYFHVNQHHHSFTLKKLSKIFLPDWTLSEYTYCGTDRLYYQPVLLFLKRKIGGIWTKTSTTVCPVCCQKLDPYGFAEVNSISMECDKRNNAIKDGMDTGKSHIVALYKRVI